MFLIYVGPSVLIFTAISDEQMGCLEIALRVTKLQSYEVTELQSYKHLINTLESQTRQMSVIVMYGMSRY